MGKRILCAVLAVVCLLGLLPVFAKAAEANIDIAAPSAILMDAATGTILFEKNDHEKLRPASVTKVMTLLLVMEALDSGKISWDDMVSASAEAAAKGGSQVYLKEGEQMSMTDMLKSVVVSSANDCATALAEHIAGSETAFVALMNQRAQELGMQDTHFVNCTGLDDGEGASEHLTSSYDIALMSRELLKHNDIKKFTTIWMDTVRDGQFGLSNTNKLVRFYDGTTGLKTGFTSTAGYCLSASAERNGMELIAVVLNCASSTDRFQSAKSLLDYGFANYALIEPQPEQAIGQVQIILGEKTEITPVLESTEPILIDKALQSQVSTTVQLEPSVNAPVEKGQRLGTMKVEANGTTLATIAIVAEERVEKLTWWQVTTQLLKALCLGA